MANTLLPGDQFVSRKAFGKLIRGQVVIFKYPGDSNQYVARIVGLPEETVQLNQKSVLINGQTLGEERVLVKPQSESQYFDPLEEISSVGEGPYRVFYTVREGDEEDGPVEETDESSYGIAKPFQIPQDCYFLLGDNRDNSVDSRYRGCVPRNLIWGIVGYIYWSESMKSGEVRWERVTKQIK
jgi:signal peptidase I